MTWAVSRGHAREFAKIALSHTVKDRLDQAYDQHNYRAEAARVMLGWQKYVAQLAAEEKIKNVVRMRGRSGGPTSAGEK